jgi:hypothetical protein
VQKAFYDGKLTAGHAIEIARLQPADQERALRECFPGHGTTAAILKDKEPRPISVRELREWIQHEIHLSLGNAPFDVNDANSLANGRPMLNVSEGVRRQPFALRRFHTAQRRMYVMWNIPVKIAFITVGLGRSK